MKPFYTLLLTIVTIFCYSQTERRKPDILFKEDLKQVFNSQKFYWFGLNYSLLKITDPNKLDDGKKLKNVFCPAWSHYFDDALPQKRIKKMLHIDSLIDCRASLQEISNLNIDPDTFVSPTSYSVEIEDLRKNLLKIKTNFTSGIGITITLENFHKLDRKVLAYVIFFDISSKRPIWITRVNGMPGGYGMTEYWGEGIYEIWAYFIGRTYDVQKKIVQKKK